MKKQKPKYSTREYLGRFSSWLLTMKGRVAWLRYDAVIECFLSTFPEKKGIEQFTSVDIADYRQIRLKQGLGYSTLQWELILLNNFWKWLIEDEKLPVNNPVRAFKYQLKITSKYKTNKGMLSLDDVNRLIAECPTTCNKRLILEIMQGGTTPTGRTRHVIRDAALRAGIEGFTFSQLKNYTRSRLTVDIIKAYCQKLLDALPLKAKDTSNTLTTVQSSALNEGASVSNSNSDLSMGEGIN